MEKITKSFTECTTGFLEKNFGLRKVTDHEHLNSWLNLAKEQPEISQTIREALLIFQGLLRSNVESWNEQDLSLHFIGPVFGFAQFTEPYRFNLFAQYLIKAEVKSQKGETFILFGKPDEMVASGYREPESPYFCFQEYKRETDPNGDPVGQLLAAMLVGQHLNPPGHAMYGCYVIGQNWHFAILSDQYFATSPAFSALTDEIFFIFKTLLALKAMVRDLTK